MKILGKKIPIEALLRKNILQLVQSGGSLMGHGYIRLL